MPIQLLSSEEGRPEAAFSARTRGRAAATQEAETLNEELYTQPSLEQQHLSPDRTITLPYQGKIFQKS